MTGLITAGSGAIGGLKGSPQHGTYAEGFEVVAGDEIGEHAFRLPAEGEIGRRRIEGRQAGKDVVAIAQIRVHRIGERLRAFLAGPATFVRADVAAARPRGIEKDELLRLRNGKTLEEDLAKNGKDAAIGANAEGQGENRDDGEAWALRQSAQPESNVLP